MTNGFPIIKSSASGATVAVEYSGKELPLHSFRDFYAFEQHVKTARSRRGLSMVPQWYEMPVFYFSNARAFITDEEPLICPRHGNWLDFELEIGAVIGKGGRDLKAEDAEEHILGFTILNDWSMRDVQREEVKVGLGPAKGKDFATSIGPAVTPLADVLKRRAGKSFDLEMIARVNGVELSRGNLKDIYYSFGEMIAYASRDTELFVGDVIGSGTVGTGCILELGAEHVAELLGRDSGWLEPGDVVELEVEEIGTLVNRIILAEDPA